MTIQEQIREILQKAYPDINMPDVSGDENAIAEIEKLIYSACQEQKKICAKEWNDCEDNDASHESNCKSYHSILNALLPTEVERCYSVKEVFEIAHRSYYIGVDPEDCQLGLANILSKEYGIKI